MEIEIYQRLNNYINLINERYITLILGFKTLELNADDILYVGNGYSIASGLVTCLNSMPYLGGDNVSLKIDGGVNIRKNIMVDDLLTNDKNFEMNKMMNKGKLEIGKNSKFGNLELNNLELKNMDIGGNIDGNIMIINNLLKIIIKNYNNTTKIINGNIENGLINMNNNRYGYIKNFKANEYKINNFYGDNINGEILNFMNFRSNIYNTENINIKNGIINKLIECQNLKGYNRAEITDTIIIKREQNVNTKILNDLYCDKIYNTKNIETTYINTEIYKYETVSVSVRRNDADSFLKNCDFKFEYGDSYSFILLNNFILTPSANFNNLTIIFDIEVEITKNIKPNKGLIFYTYGQRSDIFNIYSILFKVDYFYTDRSRINIYIAQDEGNIYTYISGFEYKIYKFNYNYNI